MSHPISITLAELATAQEEAGVWAILDRVVPSRVRPANSVTVPEFAARRGLSRKRASETLLELSRGDSPVLMRCEFLAGGHLTSCYVPKGAA